MFLNRMTEGIREIWGTPNGYLPRSVGVERRRITTVAAELTESGSLITPPWREPGIFPEDDRLFFAHDFFFNTTNAYYAPVEPPHEKYALHEPALARGSMAYAAAFTRGLDYARTPKAYTEGILHVTDSRALTAKFFAGKTALPLMEDRRVYLNTAARVLREKYDSDPINLFEQAGWRAFGTSHEGIVEILLRDFSPVFDDKDTVILADGTPCEVSFVKRAQLLPMMCYGRACASGSGLPKIKDPEAIGPIVDYVLPNVLRSKGVLVYSPALAQRIDARLEIPASSAEEIEIRMASAVAIAAIMEEVNLRIKRLNFGWDKFGTRPPVTMAELDFALWSLGRGLKTPHHFTKTLRY